MRRFRPGPIVPAIMLCLLVAAPTHGQFGGGFGGGFGGFGRGAVGGVSIDAEGIVSNLAPAASESLAAERRKLLAASPISGRGKSELRKVSLARLCEQVAKFAGGGKGGQPKNVVGPQGDPELTDLVHLGGLERISLVLVDPERHDIILAGPADRGVVDGQGNVVAAGSRRPLLRFEDFVVAMASIDRARQGGIKCSIDPTPEGIARLQDLLSAQRTIGPDPDRTLRSMERAVGMQTVSVGGVPGDSRFAQVLVAADYKLKRVGMGFEPSGVRELPSYLAMVPSTSSGVGLPRFWIEPSYDPIVRDADELAWKFSGRSMKCVTEADMFDGQKLQRGKAKADPVAAKWCGQFTNHYEKLAAVHPVFQELDNCVDLAVVAALIQGRQLDARAGIDLSILKDLATLGPVAYAVPSKVQTVASGIKKGERWVVSASGGVIIQPWAVAANTVENPDAAKLRPEALAGRPAAGWWWD